MKPIAIYHEHPDWFRPLFAELERRELPFARLNAGDFEFDPSCEAIGADYSLLFNRMSPSAYLRGAVNAIFYTLGLLEHAERSGLRVVNGSACYEFEISKSRQLSILRSLGLQFPRTRVINRARSAAVAAEHLRFPVITKANIGGSGAGIVRYDTPADLAAAVAAGSIEAGIDGTLLVQEYIVPRDGRITRVETLGGRYLYAINVYSSADSFNLCPADICQTTGGVELVRSACPVDAPKSGIMVEPCTPPDSVISAVEQIARTTSLDVGGIEYMVAERTGETLYYDVNALSNFVADAGNVIGFDPHERLVDYLLTQAGS